MESYLEGILSNLLLFVEVWHVDDRKPWPADLLMWSGPTSRSKTKLNFQKPLFQFVFAGRGLGCSYNLQEI